jgi:2-aminoadipate transaminase
MDTPYASRMSTIPKSFIREILRVTEQPGMISFAGGLPNPRFFPVRAMAEAAATTLNGTGESALQYSTTEGYRPLREYIAERYRAKRGLNVSADEILITNGSQQGLDLVGKVFVARADAVVIERPAYLGAIQALSVYEPLFCSVPLMRDGIDIDRLQDALGQHPVKLFHTVVNFQNPSGISYSRGTRETLAEVLAESETVVIEDDPYGELRFEGTAAPSMRTWLEERTVLLGSFSKTVAPGLRLGWVCAKRPVMDKLIVAKQASDLHTSIFSQRILHEYLAHHDIDEHIAIITAAYRRQRDAMVAAIEDHFPAAVDFTRPQGGMFIWATLPEALPAIDLFERAVEQKVAFVPGMPFFVDGGGEHNMRLNFSNADEETIEEGIRRLGQIIQERFSRNGRRSS